MATIESGVSSMVVSDTRESGAAPHASLAEALAAFQAEVPKMSKDETAKVKSDKANYTYGYAGLDQFVEIVEPVLGKHGLSITSISTFDDKGNFILEVKLLHESGQELGPSIWPLPDPRRSGPQDIGSSMTYGRRYLGWGLTGTFPGGIDDDGARAQAAPRESWDSAKPVQRQAPVEDRQRQAGEEPQAAPAYDPPKTTWTDDEIAVMHDRIRMLEIGKAVNGYDWMAGKGLHNRALVKAKYGETEYDSLTGSDVLALRLAEIAYDPATSEQQLADARKYAEDRGMLKAQVSATETLEQVFHEARELILHAQQNDNGTNFHVGGV